MPKDNFINPENRYSLLGIENQYFGVDIIYIKEVITLPKITKTPNVNPVIIGVFNLRGQIYSIIDLCVILGLEPKTVDTNNFVVVLESGNQSFGIVVDKVGDVVRLDNSKIQIPTRDFSAQHIHYLNGYVEDKKKRTDLYCRYSGSFFGRRNK